MYEVSAQPAEVHGVRAGKALDARRLLVALGRGRWWIAAAIVIGCGAAVPVARVLAPAKYVARASLLWEGPAEEGVDARSLRTMVDSVELPTTLAKVRARMGLAETVPEIGAAVDVTFQPESNVIIVSAARRDPDLAATLANTTVDAFLEDRRAIEMGRRAELLRALDVDVARAGAELEEARRSYDGFRDEHGIADLSAETQQAIELAASLRAEADMAQAEAEAEAARARTLRTQIRRVGPTHVTETVVSETPAPPEAGALAQARTDLADARSRMSDEHPDVQRLSARVSGLEASVARSSAAPRVQANRVVTPSSQWQALRGSIAGSATQREVALERRRSFEELAAAARERLHRLSAIEGEASALLAAQRVAEAHLDEIQGARVRAADAARAPAAGLRVVAPASRPETAEPSKKPILVAVAVPLAAALLSIALVLLAAVGRLRAHTAAEVAYWGRAPVVGASTWPADAASLVDLAEDLEDFTQGTAGRTLVVGARESDTDLARSIAFTLMSRGAPRPGHRPDPAPITADSSPGVALARRPVAWPKVWSRSALLGGTLAGQAVVENVAVPVPLDPAPVPRSSWEAWGGSEGGAGLRRAARGADRVLVVVRAGAHSFLDVARIRDRFGRDEGVGYLLVGLARHHVDLPDRVGAVDGFWAAEARA